MPRLFVSLPDGTEVTHELTDATITLGRLADNALQIEDASVSSHHGELITRGDGYVFKDLGSTNGTRINGNTLEPETEYPLTHGDDIIFGHVPAAYLTEDLATEAAPQPAKVGATVSQSVGASSVAPTDFSNASPFAKRKKEKDTAGMLVLALGVLALLAAGGVIYLVLGIQPPPVSV